MPFLRLKSRIAVVADCGKAGGWRVIQSQAEAVSAQLVQLVLLFQSRQFGSVGSVQLIMDNSITTTQSKPYNHTTLLRGMTLD